MPMTVSAFFRQAKERLGRTSCDSPALDARLLIAHGLGLTQEQFALAGDRILTVAERETLESLIAQRKTGRPVAKIIGQKEFYGRFFKTTDDTLDPRPDSETLIEVALAHAGEQPLILDLGTGTGCLVLTLLAEKPRARAIAVDRSAAALAVAKENAWQTGVEDRVVFVQSDWLDEVVGRFDLIISNPPYIPDAVVPTLAPEVRLYDPHGALAGGADGLDPYRHLVPRLAGFLKPGGRVVFEVGQGQDGDVAVLLSGAGFSDVAIVRDLGGIGRVVHGIYLQNPVKSVS